MSLYYRFKVKNCDITCVTQRNVTQGRALFTVKLSGLWQCSRQDTQITQITKCVFVIRSQRMETRSRMMKDPEKYRQAAHLPIAHGLLIWDLAAERGGGSCSLQTDADIGVPLWHCALLTPINTENKTSDEKLTTWTWNWLRPFAIYFRYTLVTR